MRIFELQLRKAGLYDFHVANGAKMVPFAGYFMSFSYGNIGAVRFLVFALRTIVSSALLMFTPFLLA